MRARVLIVMLAVSTLLVGLAPSAQATTYEQRLALASAWTQADSSSQAAWDAARLDQTAWADYAFDWSTDYCTASPDRPLGFDFQLSCERHDFGYRNFKGLNAFQEHKTHIDSAFYFDMKRVCAEYSRAIRTTCNAVAWTYYEAVRIFGSVSVSERRLDQIARFNGHPELIALSR